jgi:transcription factor TFIIIB component B''
VESPAKLQKARKKRQSSKGNSKGKRSVKEIADAIVADAMGEGVKHTQRTARGKRGRKSKQRDITPEEAENFEIEPAVVHMADLCASSNTGKKSTREAKLQERDMAKAARKREDAQRAVQEIIENPQSPTEADAVQPPPAPIEQTEPVSASRHVPTLQLINGQLMVNEDSRVIDRHANAEATREPQEEQVEDELTRHVNSGSYLKREARGKWTEELNERFYDGLRMFGTDFEMISKMFPGRTRHKIKLKFVREERKDKERIKELLLKERMPVDLAAFEKMSNTTYKDPRELDREMAEDRKRLEEEQAREKESMDEVIRQRAAEAAAESAAAGGNSSAKENEFQDGEAAKKGYRRKKSSDVTTQKGRKSKAKTSKGLKPGGIVLEEAAF